MKLTFDRRLLLSTYVQLVVLSTLGFGAILLTVVFIVEPLGYIENQLLPGAVLSAFLFGLGLHQYLHDRRQWAQSIGWLLLLLSILSLIQTINLIGPLVPMLRAYPLLAVYFLTAALCLIIGHNTRTGLWLWRVSATFWFLASVILVVGHWTHPISILLGENATATTLSSTFMLLASLCLLFIPLFGLQGIHWLSRTALYTALFTMTLTCLIWYVLNLQYSQSVRTASDNMLDNLKESIEQTALEHRKLLSRLGRGWAQIPLDPNSDHRAGLRQIAQVFLEDTPSLDVIALLSRNDESTTILASRNQPTTNWLNWSDTFADEIIASELPPVALLTDADTAWLVLNTGIEGSDNRLVATSRFNTLLEHSLHLDTAPFAIHIRFGGHEIYHLGPDTPTHTHSDLISTSTLTLMDGPRLELESIHIDPKAEAFLPNFLILLLFFGLVLSVIIAASIELSRFNYLRAKSIEISAKRQSMMRHIQEMIVNHHPLQGTLRSICHLLDSALAGYHSCLWQIDGSTAQLKYVTSYQLSRTLELSLSRKTIPITAVNPKPDEKNQGPNPLSKPTVIPDFSIEPTASISRTGYHSSQALAVQTATGQTLGVVEFFRAQNHTGEPVESLNENDYEFVREVLPLIAMAIERHQDQEQLLYASQHDALTGLPNRSMLETRLKQWYQSSEPEHTPACLLFIDLDGFKPINDGLGHAIGDRVLIEVARRLTQLFRPADLIVRFGGDEFVILVMDEIEPLSTQRLVTRVLTRLSESYSIEALEMSVTASIGITHVDSARAISDPMALIQQADIAMYDAKRKGKNNAQWYSKEHRQDIKSQVTLRHELQKALAKNEFELHYQPVIYSDGSINGFEALLRWNHPKLGQVPPDEFIPLAEETGQIIPLSEWVLDRACRDATQLRFNDNVRVGINIAPLHFHRTDFISNITETLNRHELRPDALVLELTERTLMEEHGTMLKTLKTLRSAGFRLSIDDFGTGYSSLSFIKHLPVTSVKIDKTFVADIGHSELDAGMVRAIIDMAHHLGLGVVAEGIETQEQLEKLRAWGCNSLQGYHLSRPGNLEAMVELIKSWTGLPERDLIN